MFDMLNYTKKKMIQTPVKTVPVFSLKKTKDVFLYRGKRLWQGGKDTGIGGNLG